MAQTAIRIALDTAQQAFRGVSLAALIAASYTNVVTWNFVDNSLIIRDVVTPANNYNGQLYDAATNAFNKFTFTRASTKKRVGPNGFIQTVAINIPAITYDPITNACLGFLEEGARTNLSLSSQIFGSAPWGVASGSVADNTLVAPDGTTTGATLTEDGTVATHYIIQTSLVVTNAPTTRVVWLKQLTQRYAIISLIDSLSVDRGCAIDLQTGIATTYGSATSATSVQYASGWWRCEFTCTPAVGSAQIVIAASDTSASPHTYQGTGKTIGIWGDQTETGAASSSYIPTTTVAVTRATDMVTLSGALFNLTQAGGTLYSKFIPKGVSAFDRILSVNDNTTGNETCIQRNLDVARAFVTVATVSQANLSGAAASLPLNTPSKFSLAYAAADFSLVANGAAPVTSASGTLPTTTQLNIGGTANSSGIENIMVEGAFIGQRISNAAQQALTT